MRRREFITLFGGAAAWMSPARAQEPRQVIGVLSSFGSSGLFADAIMPAFVQGLKDAGFVEGRNISIEIRDADGHYDRLPSLPFLVTADPNAWALAAAQKVARYKHAQLSAVRLAGDISGNATMPCADLDHCRLTVSLSLSAKCYADLGQADDAWRCIDEAKAVIERTKETWFEADVHRLAGEVALMSSQPDMAKAEAYFERALEVARQQQAKSWELRAAMSMARLWRDQGKRDEARELLAPVYGWFTEGFNTRDLKEAKALLEELAA